MASWGELSADSRTAAYELFEQKRWRSFASRSYYAVYSDVTRCLLLGGIAMPAGQNNPKHKALAGLITTLGLLKPETRQRLAGLVHTMYNFRLIADYKPHVTLVEEDARVVLGLMRQALKILEAIP